MENDKFFFTCINCHKKIESRAVVYLCASCSKDNTSDKPPKGVLKTIYNFNAIRAGKKTSEFFEHLKQNNFIDILPVHSKLSFSPLRVGNTPLYAFKSDDFSEKSTKHTVFFKDDALNPTFSHKDRASNLVSAYAKEQGITTIVAASTGNAGSSIAGICASQGQKAIVMVPARAPKAKLIQIMQYGATIVPVEGTYDDAFELSLKVSAKYGYYNRNTAYNPFTIEGKKTAALEMFDNLNQQLPDIIFVSAGDGVIASGIYKGFEDLMQLGITEKLPLIVTVQSEKSKNIAANLEHETFINYPATTIADSISVDVPRNFYMARHFILKYGGQTLIVTDEEILSASLNLSRTAGIFSEPASAAAFAGYLKYASSHSIKTGSKIVCLLTGCGLKDLKNVESLHQMPLPINPNIESFDIFMQQDL